MTALGLSLWRTLTEIYMYDVIDRCLFASSLDDDSHESLLVFWKKVFLRLHQQAQQYSCRVDQRAVRRRPLGSTLKTQLDGTLDETWLHQQGPARFQVRDHAAEASRLYSGIVFLAWL
jgi:hypothetical protein